MNSAFVTEVKGCSLLRLQSTDGTNRLTRACVHTLTGILRTLARPGQTQALVITGNEHFFSAGADLREIAELDGQAAYEFSRMGQKLMTEVAAFPAPVYAAISGYCMGGGLDLALACQYRVASPRSIFGHRGAALGLVTGWGGTQRLPRLIGRARAVEMFVAAEKLNTEQALRIGLIDWIAADPVANAIERAAR